MGSADVRARYLGCDFARESDERWLLLDALVVLTVAQRLAWQARFCGLTSCWVDGAWALVPGPRLSVPQAADYLVCDEEELRNLTYRAAARLAAELEGASG